MPVRPFPFVHSRRRFLVALASLAATRPLAAQSIAPAAITLIVPAPAGGSADAIGRLVADALAGIMELPVRVENIAG